MYSRLGCGSKATNISHILAERSNTESAWIEYYLQYQCFLSSLLIEHEVVCSAFNFINAPCPPNLPYTIIKTEWCTTLSACCVKNKSPNAPSNFIMAKRRTTRQRKVVSEPPMLVYWYPVSTHAHNHMCPNFDYCQGDHLFRLRQKAREQLEYGLFHLHERVRRTDGP